MLANINGHVVVVMAPTGSGKGTLIKEALKVFPGLYQTVSCTTRAMRPGEVDGREYHFLSAEQFEKRKEKGDFLEWAYFGQNQYGTLKSEILPRLEDGKMVITEIEVQGVEQLKSLIPDEHITTVYIEAGGWEILKSRAIKRAPISEEELEHRYERYLIEVTSKDLADRVIKNTADDFTAAKEDFCKLIEEIKNHVYKN